MKKSSPGFTLVELMVTLTAAALVLACAVTFVLLGVRMENRSTETASQQRTVRIMLTMTEKLAAEGTIGSIKTVDEGWTLYTAGAQPQPLLQYLPSEGALRYGDAVMLSNLEDADASMQGNLFTISLKTNGKEYKTSVFCRVGGINTGNSGKEEAADIIEDAKKQSHADFGATREGRLAFLNALSGQYGSMGEIKGTKEFFSKWYIGEYKDGWNENTPWCGCFLSWGAAQAASYQKEDKIPHFANVDKWLETLDEEHRNDKPVPGDIVFFSWDGDDNPEHAGAVLYVSDDGKTVYTIEGNSNGKVAVNSYPIDSDYIVGYGVLSWTT